MEEERTVGSGASYLHRRGGLLHLRKLANSLEVGRAV